MLQHWINTSLKLDYQLLQPVYHTYKTPLLKLTVPTPTWLVFNLLWSMLAESLTLFTSYFNWVNIDSNKHLTMVSKNSWTGLPVPAISPTEGIIKKESMHFPPNIILFVIQKIKLKYNTIQYRQQIIWIQLYNQILGIK